MKKLLAISALLILFISCNRTEDTSQSSTDDVVIITTDFGEIHCILYDETPQHKENFLKLANEGFYDSTTFHRVMQGFMIQGGDPNSKDEVPFNDGQGGPGYTVEAEFNNSLVHTKGALAAARTGGPSNPQKRSSGSQFYIVQGEPVPSIQLDQMLAQRNRAAQEEIMGVYLQAPENAEVLAKLRMLNQTGMMDSLEAEIMRLESEILVDFIPTTYSAEQRALYAEVGGAPFLDGNYTVFGEVIQGLEIVDEIAAVSTDEADRPFENVTMSISVKTMDKKDITEEYGYSYQ